MDKVRYAHLNTDVSGGMFGFDKTAPLPWIVTSRKRPTNPYSYPVCGLAQGYEYVMPYTQLERYIIKE